MGILRTVLTVDPGTSKRDMRVALEEGAKGASKAMQNTFVREAKQTGDRTASEMLKAFSREFRSRQGALKELKALGKLDPQGFRREMNKLKREYDRGIFAVQSELRKQARLTDAEQSKLRNSLKAVGRTAGQTGKRFGALGRTLKSVRGTVLGLVAGFVSITGISRGIRAMASATTRLDKAMGQVRTLTDSTGRAFDLLTERVRTLSTRIPRTAEDLGAGLYQVLSSGVTDTDEAFQVLEASARLAAAGLLETEASVDAVTTVLNAYGMSADQAADVTDVFFKTVEQGKLTVPELAQNIGTVATTAAQAGVPIDEVGAALAALTATGVDTAEAASSLNRFLLSIVQPTNDVREAATALGIEWSVAGLRARGLGGFMADLNEAAGGNIETLVTLNPNIRAFRAASVLAGSGAERFANSLRAMADRAGAADEALGKVNKTISAQWDLVRNRFSAALTRLGDKILPTVVSALEGLTRGLESSFDRTLRRLRDIGVEAGQIDSLMRGYSRRELRAAQQESTSALGKRVHPVAVDHLRMRALSALGEGEPGQLGLESIQQVIANVERLQKKWANEGARLAIQLQDQARALGMSVEDAETLLKLIEDSGATISRQEHRTLRNLQAKREAMIRQAEAAQVLLEDLRDRLDLEEQLLEIDRKPGSQVPETKRDGTVETASGAAEREPDRAQLQRLIDEYRLAGQLGLTFLDDTKELGSRLEEARGHLKEVLRLDREIARLEELKKRAAGEQAKATAEIVGNLRDQREAALAAARAAQALEVAEQVRLTMEEIARAMTVGVDGATASINEWADTLERVAAQAAEAKHDLDVAEAIGDPVKIDAAKVRLAEVSQHAEQLGGKLLAAFEAAGLPAEVLRSLQGEILELLQGINAEGDEFVEAGEEAADTWGDAATAIEGIGRGVLSVLDAAGALDDDLRRILQGVVDIAMAWRQVQEAQAAAQAAETALSFSAAAGPIAAGIGAVIAIGSALFGRDDKRERERQKQIEAMKRLRDALDKLRDTIHPTISAAERQETVRAVQDIIFRRGTLGGLNAAEFDKLRKDEQEAIKALFALVGQDLDKALEELDGFIGFGTLQELLETAKALDLSAFASDLEGQLDALQFVFSALGDEAGTAAERMGRFLDVLARFSPTAAAQLERAFEEDPEAARDLLQQWAEVLAGGGQGLESLLTTLGLSAADLQRIIQEGLGFIESGGDPVSRSVQIGRSITEIQAVEVVAWLEDIAHTAREIRDLIAGRAQIRGLVEMAAAIPTAALAAVGGPAALPAGSVTAGNGPSITVGDVRISPDVDEEAFQWLWRRAGEEVYRRGFWPGTVLPGGGR